MSSLELAQNINERGVYCVGQLNTTTTLQPSDKKTVDSVVNLVLPLESDSNTTFREYSLGKLQELQSKLALISGKRSTGQDDVDKFNQVWFFSFFAKTDWFFVPNGQATRFVRGLNAQIRSLIRLFGLGIVQYSLS